MNLHLQNLNDAQRRAVTAPPERPLAILAGPGSGKTRVLTCRVAHLVQAHDLSPNELIVCTFTNKAANEMKHRLNKLLGSDRANSLVIGTFHSLCALYLRKYGGRIALSTKFVICDAEDARKMISSIVKSLKGTAVAAAVDSQNAVGPEYFVAQISKAKAKDQTAESCRAEAQKAELNQRPMKRYVAAVYEEYQTQLKAANALDFDDLLMLGLKMFRAYPAALRNIRHVLCDEFQDTNTTQYQLLRNFAKASQCITIVGDPDQSIYGWRSAEVENLTKFQKEYDADAVNLEENYRSFGSILSSSTAVISQDRQRIEKGLTTNHPTGPLPSIMLRNDGQEEANFIASEVKRLVAETGAMLNYNDFAVLLRFSALSRPVEAAFQARGIPSRMIGGVKFFDRAEVKDILAYLQLADSPDYLPAFNRVINVPKRGIGEKTLEDLLDLSKSLAHSPLALLESLADGETIQGLKPSLRSSTSDFIKAIREARQLADQGAPVAEIIQQVCDIINYQKHLEKTEYGNWQSRWENISELQNYATLVSAHSRSPDISVDGSSELSAQPGSLTYFLQASMLNTDAQNKDDEAKEKVTLLTCHAAKGLEWPVVFVISVEDGTFPFYRCLLDHEIREERRLLYVAMTRAQTFLYLTQVNNRMGGGSRRSRAISPFVSSLVDCQNVFSRMPPVIDKTVRGDAARVLSRPLPDEQKVAKLVELHKAENIRRYSGLNCTRSERSDYSLSRRSNKRRNDWEGEDWDEDEDNYDQMYDEEETCGDRGSGTLHKMASVLNKRSKNSLPSTSSASFSTVKVEKDHEHDQRSKFYSSVKRESEYSAERNRPLQYIAVGGPAFTKARHQITHHTSDGVPRASQSQNSLRKVYDENLVRPKNEGKTHTKPFETSDLLKGGTVMMAPEGYGLPPPQSALRQNINDAPRYDIERFQSLGQSGVDFLKSLGPPSAGPSETISNGPTRKRFLGTRRPKLT